MSKTKVKFMHDGTGGSGEAVIYKSVPVVGQVCAGKTGESIECLAIIKWRDIRLPSWAKPNDRFCAAEINGDSLKNDGIFDGDFAIIHITQDLSDGNLAAVFTSYGMLIKYIFLNADGRVRLESANDEYPPLYFEPIEITIQGKVIRTERDY